MDNLETHVKLGHKTHDEDKQSKKHTTKTNKAKNTRRRQTTQKTHDEDKQSKKHTTKTNKAKNTYRKLKR